MPLPAEIAIVCVCLFMGGLLKGATGAGAPVLAVPALATFFDVRFAVVTMLVANLSTNSWQGWRFRRHLPDKRFVLPFIIGGGIGVIAGSLLLVSLPQRWLALAVALAVFAYIGMRLAKPHWQLDLATGTRLALPAGALSGLLQGASGLSAPASLSFLNALRFDRPTFIAAISALFTTFTAIQFVTLVLAGLVTPYGFMISVGALIPVSLAMPVGAWLARHLSPVVFDRIILAFLGVLALKLFMDAVLG